MPNALPCVSEPELARFVHGDFDVDRLQQIADHVDDCDLCQDTVVALAEQSDTFVAAIRAAGSSEPTPQENPLKLGLKRMLASLRRSRNGDAVSVDFAGIDSKQLGPYRIEEQLGVGGMGHVYRATHTKLKRTVALKVLPANRWSNTMAVSRFEREMEAIGGLDHPHIVRASDAGEDNGMHYLVMEYIDGLDLARLVNRLGPLPIADACALARQAASGLHHAHEKGLVHRDIKPSNLMLAWDRSSGLTTNDKPTLKILDLGLALLGDEYLRDGHELTTVGTLMGTLDYMSPEQGIDSHSVDQRTDVYSLGATLFKLLTGRAPYADPQFATLMKKMTALATKPAPSIGSIRSDLPKELVVVIDRMLSRDPDDRFENVRDVAEALGPFADGANLGKLLRRAIDTVDPTDDVGPRAPVTAFADATATALQEKSENDRSGTSKWILAAAAGFLALATGVLFRMATDYGELVVRSDDPTAAVLVKRGTDTVKELRIEKGEQKIRLRTGEYELEVTGDAEVSIEPRHIVVDRGQALSAKVSSETGLERSTPVESRGLSWRRWPNDSEKLSALLDEQALLAEKYGPNHPQRRTIESQIDAMRNPHRQETSANQKWSFWSSNQPSSNVGDNTQGIIHLDSSLLLRVLGTTPDRPIDGVFRLEPSGHVHLGPGYGRVKIDGLTFEQAEEAIKTALLEQLQSVEVMVTLPRPESLSNATGQSVLTDPALQQTTSLTSPELFGSANRTDGTVADSIERWLRVLEVEREYPKLYEAVHAMKQLGYKNSPTVSKTLLRMMRQAHTAPNPHFEPMSSFVQQTLVNLNRDDVLAAVFDEFEHGNARSRDFILEVVEAASAATEIGDWQRLRDTFRKHGVELAKARLANPQDITLELATTEKFLLMLAQRLRVDPSEVPGMTEVFRQAIQRELPHGSQGEEHRTVVGAMLVLAEHAPETSGLIEKLTELKESVGGDRYGNDNQQFMRAVELLGAKAAPILPLLIDDLEASFDLAGGNSNFITPDALRMVHPIIETIGEMGSKAKPAHEILTRIYEFTSNAKQPHDTIRITKLALAKIDGASQTESLPANVK